MKGLIRNGVMTTMVITPCILMIAGVLYAHQVQYSYEVGLVTAILFALAMVIGIVYVVIFGGEKEVVGFLANQVDSATKGGRRADVFAADTTEVIRLPQEEVKKVIDILKDYNRFQNDTKLNDIIKLLNGV